MKNNSAYMLDKRIMEIVHEPFVSILTPVYNGEEFLRECIESVFAQDYSNWEYVLVNNQSTDNTLQIIEEYATKDKRVRVHNNKKFLPQMENLNYAFKHISPKSKYCKVIHADDTLFPDCISRMVEVAEKYPSVGIVAAYRTNGDSVGLDGLPYPNNYCSGKEVACQFLMHGNRFFGAPSNILIRSSLIRKRENVYDPSYLESDVTACLDMLKESDYGFVHQILTFSRYHPNSLTNTIAIPNYTDILGDLRIYVDSAPLFLSDEIHKQVIKKQEHIFYVRFARNLLAGNMKEKYYLHVAQLKSVNFRIMHGKLFKFLIRELFLKLIERCGFRVTRYSGNH